MAHHHHHNQALNHHGGHHGGGGGIPDDILKQILQQQEERKAKQGQFYLAIVYLGMAYVMIQHIFPWCWDKYLSHLEKERVMKELQRELEIRRRAEADATQMFKKALLSAREAAENGEDGDDGDEDEEEEEDEDDEGDEGAEEKGKQFTLARPSAPLTLEEAQRLIPAKKSKSEANKKGPESQASKRSPIPPTLNPPVSREEEPTTLRRRTGAQVVHSSADTPSTSSSPHPPRSGTQQTQAEGPNPWAMFTSGSSPDTSSSSLAEASSAAAERELARDRQIRAQQDKELAISLAADKLRVEQLALLEKLRNETYREEKEKENKRITAFYAHIGQLRSSLPVEPVASVAAASTVTKSAESKGPSTPAPRPAQDPLTPLGAAFVYGVTFGQVNLFPLEEEPATADNDSSSSSSSNTEDLKSTTERDGESAASTTVLISFRLPDNNNAPRLERRFNSTDTDTDVIHFLESSDAFLELLGLPSLDTHATMATNCAPEAALANYPGRVYFTAEGSVSRAMPAVAASVGLPRKDLGKTGAPLSTISEVIVGGRCLIYVRLD